MGDEAQRSYASRRGISLPTLSKILYGQPVRSDVAAKFADLTGGR